MSSPKRSKSARSRPRRKLYRQEAHKSRRAPARKARQRPVARKAQRPVARKAQRVAKRASADYHPSRQKHAPLATHATRSARATRSSLVTRAARASQRKRLAGAAHAIRSFNAARQRRKWRLRAIGVQAPTNGRRSSSEARRSRPNVANLPRSASPASVATLARRHSVALARASQRAATAAVAVVAPIHTRRSDRVRRLVVVALLVAVLLALIPAPMLAYSSTMSLARDGVAHLTNAESDFKALASNPTNLALITDAQRELQRAHDDFDQLQLRVALVSPAVVLPRVGGKVSTAGKLAPLAVEGTQAGILACDALKTLVAGLHDPLGARGGLTGADMRQISSDVDQIHALYGQMVPQIQRLTPADLSFDPRLAPLVESLRARLPEVTRLLDDLDGLAHVAPQLLGVGKPATYLVEVLDSSELRPTGGFIGNFGALTLDSGRLSPNFHISDITLIDSSVKFDKAPHRQFIPIPEKYRWLNAVFVSPTGNSWSLRDSNLDADYPTTARYALSLYSQLLPDAQKNLAAQSSPLKLYNPAKSGAFAGVITLNLGLFQQALAITGPITIAQFHQKVTASNFVSLIHSYALGPNATGPDNKACGVTSCSKVFTSEVVQAFMAKVKSNLPLYIGRMGKLLFDSLRTKDVELYFTAPPAQRLLDDLNLSATIAAPAHGDSVFDVEANVAANKDNYFLKYQMADQISIDQAGAATHLLTWSYTWPNDPATLRETFAAGGPDYYAYVRVYAPPGASLLSQSGLLNFGSSLAFDRQVYSGNVTDSFGQTARYALAWTVPGAVTRDRAGFHYHLIFQRQAGIAWPLTLSVALPSCATMTSAPVTSGLTAQNHVTVKGDRVVITGPLTMDAQLTINYTCSSASANAHTGPAHTTARATIGYHWNILAARLGR